MEYLSPVRWGYTALLLLQFPDDSTPLSKTNTEKFLVDSGLENDKIWLCVFMLVVLTPATFYYMHVVKDSSMEMTLAVCYCVVICSTLLLFASLKV